VATTYDDIISAAESPKKKSYDDIIAAAEAANAKPAPMPAWIKSAVASQPKSSVQVREFRDVATAAKKSESKDKVAIKKTLTGKLKSGVPVQRTRPGLADFLAAQTDLVADPRNPMGMLAKPEAARAYAEMANIPAEIAGQAGADFAHNLQGTQYVPGIGNVPTVAQTIEPSNPANENALEKTARNAAGFLPFAIPGYAAAQLPTLAMPVGPNGESGIQQMAQGAYQNWSDPVKAIKEGKTPNLIMDLAMAAGAVHGVRSLRGGKPTPTEMASKPVDVAPVVKESVTAELTGSKPVANKWWERENEQATQEPASPGGHYHGSSREITDLGNTFERYQSQNLYGPGFYTTDNVTVAKEYTGKGKGTTPTVYNVQWIGKKSPNLVNLDDRLPVDAFDAMKHAVDDIVDLDPMKSGKRLYQDVKDALHDEGATRQEAEDVLDSIRYNLQNSGYDGLAHIGGDKLGNTPHSVEIYFSPIDELTGKPNIKLEKYVPAAGGEPPVAETVRSAETPSGYGSHNSIVTTDAYNSAVSQIKASLGSEAGFVRISRRGKTPQPGYKPIADANSMAKIVAYHLEAGARSVGEAATNAARDLELKGTSAAAFIRDAKNNPEIRKQLDQLSPAHAVMRELSLARTVNHQREEMYAEQRSRRAGKLAAALRNPKLGNEESFKLGMTKGRFDQPTDMRLNITPEQRDSLMGRLRNTNRLSLYEKANAQSGLVDMLDGRIPQPKQRELLAREFGPEFSRSMSGAFDAWRSNLLYRGWTEFDALLRTLQTGSADQGWAGIQGWRMMLTRPKVWGKAVKQGWRGYWNGKTAENIQVDIRKDPMYDRFSEAGLNMVDHDIGVTADLREEMAPGGWTEKVPGIGRLVKAANRSFEVSGNVARFTMLKNWVQGIEKSGREIPPEQVATMAQYVNTLSGRPKLPQKLQALSGLAYALKMNASFFKWPTYLFYTKDPIVMKQAWKDFAVYSTATVGAIKAAQMAGLPVETDPHSSEFGKARVGKTRIDLTGGYGFWIRWFTQFASGKKKDSTGSWKTTSPNSMIGDLMHYKAAPSISTTIEAATRKNVFGKPMTTGADWREWAGGKAYPLIAQDAIDAYYTYGPGAALGVMPFSYFGGRIQTYKDKPKNTGKDPFSFNIDLNMKF
jgi:hypothetical protein